MKLNRFRVLELMENAGYKTQNELADAIGVSRQALSSWLRGGTFTVENLAALCSALGCTPNDVLNLQSLPKVTAPASIVAVV